ncbi:single-stranded DNA-binding protein [Streptomyces sp. NRRL B-24484]|uniref:single-stranded DNA-binding protein n=1 Tax=Streptomyces sp. NRRL B-24484 TaxID=1463833 RepID=UPI000998DBA5|nr:single-stranded DNA-binding protein [Streptomyces sp. NRRL B-24484]
MNETLVTIVGNVASTVTYAQTPAGVPVANFRMATTERRFDRGTGDWVDGETTWVTVVAWRWLATNLVSSVNKGDPVVVSGRLRVREWGEEDRRRTAVEIDARSVGHDLSRGTSAFRWAVRGRPDREKVGSDAFGPSGGRRVGDPAPVGEAVPEWIVAAVEARRAADRTTAGPAGAVGPASPPVLAGAAGASGADAD